MGDKNLRTCNDDEFLQRISSEMIAYEADLTGLDSDMKDFGKDPALPTLKLEHRSHRERVGLIKTGG
jgi:hypothetical protein